MSTWLENSRENGAKNFAALAIPNRKNELFKYTYVGNLNWEALEKSVSANKSFVSKASEKLPSRISTLPNVKTIDLSFFRAESVAEFSQLGVDVFPFTDESDISDIEPFAKHFDQLASKHISDDKFAQLAAANFSAGYCVRIRRNTKVEIPLQLLYGDSWGTNLEFSYRGLLVVEEGAEVTVIDNYASVETPDEEFIRSGILEVFVEANAKLNYISLIEEEANAAHFRRTLVALDSAAQVKATNVYLGGGKVQDRWEIFLKGNGSEFISRGAGRVREESSLDFIGDVHHIGSHTKSGIDFWSVAENTGKVIFNGLVDVDKEALHTDAFQKNHGLVLDRGATIHSMPKLIIGTDEVACAHGASIARLSDEQLFYLQSRGIDSEAAKRMIVNGFTAPALTLIQDRDIAQSINDMIVGGATDE